jgi:tetratricopeptide (TPR) repeat protein
MIPKLYIKHYALGIVLLTVLFGCTTEAERRQMRAGLDSINVLNRTDQPFTPDDVRPYVDFFDKEAKAFFTLLSSDSIHNDQLLAHYLLGRAFHEKGDAPMALESYQHAIDHADTTSASCDYRQLSRVYGQMAELFYQQGLYRQQLDHEKSSIHYAWKGGDTLGALMSYEMECSAYRNLNKLDSIIIVTDSVYKMYNKYGFPDYAATSLSNIFSILINNKELERAKGLMDIYESKSLFFDSLGNIEHGREIYYKVKGYYYKEIGRLDSAEYYFRKELNNGKDFNNQNAGALGLAEVFIAKHLPDSASKYYRYSYDMNDSMFAHKTTSTIKRIQSIYNYSHHQKVAKQESEKASRLMVFIWICICIILVLLLFVLIGIFISWNMKNEREKIKAEYQRSIETISKAQKDLSLLQLYKELNVQLIKDKEELIKEQNNRKKDLLQKSKINQNIASTYFKSLPIYLKFSKHMDSGKQPTRSDWTDLQDALFNSYPGFSEFMQKYNDDLTDREYKICLLIRADFKPVGIGNMLCIASSYVTQIRIDLHQKLFKKSGNSKDFDNHIKRIF